MTKETQDLAWQCLPKEARYEIRKLFNKADTADNFTAMGVFLKIFGHHNLTSDEEPPELLFIEREKVQNLIKSLKTIDDYTNGIRYCAKTLFGDKCLPDKEPSVQDEPKFKVGELIMSEGKVGRVLEYDSVREFPYLIHFPFNNSKVYRLESDLEPYTETEAKDMEEKELNLSKLLKGCEGDTFFHPHYGDVELVEVTDNFIELSIVDGGTVNIPAKGCLYPTGMAFLYPDAESMKKYIFDGSEAWDEWAEERKPKRWRSEKGEIYWWIDDELNVHECKEDNDMDNDANYEVGNYFKDEQTAKRAAEAVRECLAKFQEKISSQNLHNPK